MIEINTSLGVKNFRPGEVITGTLLWSFDQAPEEILVNLIWHTQGRGTEDADQVDQLVIPQQAKRGEANFSLKIPTVGPWSYSGSLISIIWVIEVVTSPAIEKAELEIIIAPEANEIVIVQEGLKAN